jgi:hypothetical protein
MAIINSWRLVLVLEILLKCTLNYKEEELQESLTVLEC